MQPDHQSVGPMPADPQSVGPKEPDPQQEGHVHELIARLGCVPHHQPQPLPSDLAKFEDPTENPCRCCCRLITATKTILVINLIYLVFYIFGYLMKIMHDPTEPKKDSFGHFNQIEVCAWLQAKFETPLMTTVHVLLGLNIATCLSITIGYTVTVFGHPIVLETKTKVLFCNLYEWSHFCNPSWLLTLLSFIDLLYSYDKKCPPLISQHITWVVVFASIVLTTVWYGFNGTLARAYRNALQRQASRASRVASQHRRAETATTSTANPPLAGGDASKMPSATGTKA